MRLLELARQVPAEGPAWLDALRREQLARFESLGLPDTKFEDWRMTNVAPLGRLDAAAGYERATAVELASLPAEALIDLGFPRLTFVNGRLIPELSDTAALPGGVSLTGFAERWETVEALLKARDGETPVFAALNGANLRDGAFLDVAAGVELDTPLQVLFVTAAAAEPVTAHPRLLARLGESSRATLVECHVGTGAGVYFSNPWAEVHVAADARLDHVRVQADELAAYHVGGLNARLERDARYRSHNVCLGARLARLDVSAAMHGAGAEATLNGLFVTEGEQHIDNHTSLDHAVAHCPSHELYKGILGGKSRAVFNGRIIVRQDAQKTDAKQSNKNLLLSPDATVHTRPQLEIYADDVKCTHGATIGHMQDDALFYLRARGIGAREARQLLIRAFAADVLEAIEPEALREAIEARALTRVARAVESGHVS